MGILTASGITAQFRRTAEAVAEKVGDLLRAPVLIVNPEGMTVAASTHEWSRLVAHQLSTGGDLAASAYLRVPFRLGEYNGEVLVGEPQEEEPVSPRLAQALVEMVVNEIAVIDRFPNQHEVKNKFIYELLHGRIDDDERIYSQARFLGMDLAPPRAVILIDAKDYFFAKQKGAWLDDQKEQARIQRKAQLIISSIVSYFHLSNYAICAYIGNGEVAVLKASNTKNLARWARPEVDTAEGGAASDDIESFSAAANTTSWSNLAALKRAAGGLLTRLRNDTRASVSIGIGRYHPGLRGLALSYQDARASLTLGERLRGHNRVHCLDELGIAGFVGVSDEKTKIELALHLLSPLDHEPELLQTLSTFFELNCSPSSAAGALAIHRNTLTYRLDKIASLTGLDPRRFDDAVQARLALLLRTFQPDDIHFPA
jgi:carbohydrate diacid regulator